MNLLEQVSRFRRRIHSMAYGRLPCRPLEHIPEEQR